MTPKMTTTEAIRHIRASRGYGDLIEQAYLDEDTEAAVARFRASAEFCETLRLLPALANLTILDLGAGTGLATRALAEAGAAHVIAVEPELDDVVGLGALAAAPAGLPITSVGAVGSALPLSEASVDVVYCRQVLHHLSDLGPSLREAARVLRPGGWFIATREHVVDDDTQLEAFLAKHPVHQLAGGEGAWSLDAYRAAITGAGLTMPQELGPWESVVNAYPAVETDDELQRAPELMLARRTGPLIGRVAALPGIRVVVWRRLRRAKPGRLFSFVARKP